VAHDLEDEYDVIMPDMRGHGLSARVQPDEDVDMTADLAALIRHLDVERPIVGGHSMGAGVTYQLGLRFPELARALFLEDPGWRLSWPEPPADAGAEPPILTWARKVTSMSMDELLEEYHQDHPNWSDELIRLMCESKTQLDPTISEIMIGRMRDPKWNWLTTLPDVTHPLLLIAANSDLGGLVTPEAMEKARELKPDMTIAHVPDVGHLIRFDKYPAFMDALREFLKQLPA
jgi:pimeloyl-ACP methyl ester carboxylesterase